MGKETVGGEEGLALASNGRAGGQCPLETALLVLLVLVLSQLLQKVELYNLQGSL